jgi:hypothetical protein
MGWGHKKKYGILTGKPLSESGHLENWEGDQTIILKCIVR